MSIGGLGPQPLQVLISVLARQVLQNAGQILVNSTSLYGIRLEALSIAVLFETTRAFQAFQPSKAISVASIPTRKSEDRAFINHCVADFFLLLREHSLITHIHDAVHPH